MRESFMMASARSRVTAPPRPSAVSAMPSSWKAPVSHTVASVLSAAATKAPSAPPGSTRSAPHSTSAPTAPTTQPTPGKCPALARSMAGL